MAAQFLNVDLLLMGEFNRSVLLKGFGRGAFALNGAPPDKGPLCLEITRTSSFATTLREWERLCRRLPAQARRAWNDADRRVFDIGFEGRTGDHAQTVTVDDAFVAFCGEFHAEIAVTVYPA